MSYFDRFNTIVVAVAGVIASALLLLFIHVRFTEGEKHDERELQQHIELCQAEQSQNVISCVDSLEG